MRGFLAAGLAVLAALSIPASTVRAQDADRVAGFRLLDLDGARVRWGAVGDRTPEVTYAFAKQATSYPGAHNCRTLAPFDELLAKSVIPSDMFRAEVRAAFDLWERVANIDFREVDDPATAGIVLGAQGEPTGHAFADVTYKPGPGPVRQIARSLVCLNPTKTWKIGFDGNLLVYDLRYTIAHEIGHAIGLDHPTPRGSLMSFSYSEGFRAPQEGDVAGAVKLYGLRQPGSGPHIETGSTNLVPRPTTTR